jgi:CRP-like cAMP-binding protein
VSGKVNLKAVVAAHPFLAGTRPKVRHVFYQCATLHNFEQGQQIFCEGGEANDFYLINRGLVILEIFVPGRGMVTIQTVEPGQALGWSWLFPPHQWRFSAKAAEPTQAIAFAAKALREKAQQDHAFCYELVVRLAAVLAGRLEDMRSRLIYSYQDQPNG